MILPNQGVIFDMDGVIFNTEQLLIDCWKVLADRDQIPDIEAVCHRCLGVTKDITRKNFFDAYGPDFAFDAYQKELFSLFQEKARQGLPVKKGVFELLTFLKNNHIPTAIASSTYTPVVKQELSDAGLLPFFDVIIGGDQVQRSKPAPDIFLKAAAALDRSPAVCYGIEDSFNGIRALKAAGLTSIMVPDILLPDQTILPLCDHVFPSLLDVRSFLMDPK